MDPNEFNLIYDKESPLFKGDMLRSIIEQVLEEEQIPHSVVPSNDSKQGHILDSLFQKNSQRNSALCARKRVTQNDTSIKKDIKNQCSHKQSTTVVTKSSAHNCATRIGTISSSSFGCSCRDLLFSSQKSLSHPSKTAVSDNISGGCSHKDCLSGQNGLKSPFKYSQPQFPKTAFGEYCFRGTSDNGTRACQGNGSVANSTCRSVEELRPSRSEVHTDRTHGYSILENPYRSSHKQQTSSRDSFSSHKVDKECQDQPFEFCRRGVKNACSILSGCKIDLPTMPCECQALNSSKPSLSVCHVTPGVVQRPEAIKCGATDVVDGEKRVAKCGAIDKVTEIKDTNKDQSENIIPVEIGRFDKKDLKRMIEILVNANCVFKEFPRKDEPENIILVQKQNYYLENMKSKGTEVRPEEDKHKIRSRVLEDSVKYIEMRIAESVRFAKKIPQFSDLPLEDQANLIRESRTESGIVGGMRGINAEKGVFTSIQGSFYSLEDMKLVYDENLLQETIRLSKKIVSLNMSVEEEAILRAMTITATDRCKLLRRDIAEDIQNKLMSCLLHVTSAGARPVSRRLGKMFDILRDCRSLTEVEMEQAKKIFLEWPSFSNYKLAEEFL